MQEWLLEIDPGQDTIYVELKKEKKGKTNEVRVNNSCSIYKKIIMNYNLTMNKDKKGIANEVRVNNTWSVCKINKELQSNDELMHIYTRIDMTSYIQMI